MYSDQKQKPQSRFVSFGRFLEANRGEADRQAKALADDVEQRGQKVETELAGEQKKFDEGVQAGTVRYRSPESGDKEMQTPAAAAEQMRARSYTGPTQMRDMSAQGQDVSDRAQSLGSQAGIGALMQQRAQGAYGSGARRFDAGLTGAAGGERFAQLRQRFGGMAERLDAASRAAAERAAQAQAESTSAAELYGRDADEAARLNAKDAEMQAQAQARAERKAAWLKATTPGLAGELDMFYDKASPQEQQQVDMLLRHPDPLVRMNLMPRLVSMMREKYGNR